MSQEVRHNAPIMLNVSYYKGRSSLSVFARIILETFRNHSNIPVSTAARYLVSTH